MRFTNRLLERRFASGVALVLVSASLIGASASCAGDHDEDPNVDGADAAPDVLDAASANDASNDGPAVDDAHGSRDAATSDAGPLPVVCTSPPCVTSLTTTFGAVGEGFCALLEDGRVACWGQNQTGQLGRGIAAGNTDSATATAVVGLSNIVELDHTCAVDDAGGTWCWGRGPYLRNGLLMTTEFTPVKLPVPDATKVAMTMNAGTGTAVGCVEGDAGLLCWGSNEYGQLEAPTIGADPYAVLEPRSIAVPAGARTKRLALGLASFLLQEDGTLLTWGINPPLGRVSSLVPDPYPGAVALDLVSDIDIVQDSACAVAEGIAYCWGNPIDGDLTKPLQRALPAIVPTPEPVTQIAATAFAANYYTLVRGCAVGVSGTVYCWGNNVFGQVGDGTKDYAITATAVVGLPGPAAQVRTTPRSTCAVLTTGKVFCWGGNDNGQLGNGQAKEPSLVPQEVVLP